MWLLTGLVVLLLMRWVLPYMAEQIQYAITRGKERAEMEAAATGLENLKLVELSKAFQMVANRVAPSVVNINVASVVSVAPQDELSALFGPQHRISQGQGSGVIVDADGYVLTNSHVVRGATEIDVALSDGRVFRARVVGEDPLTDLALIKLEGATKLIPGEWGDSDKLEVGDLVWAVGSPFGLQQSVTAGILSGKNRSQRQGPVYYDFLQTDAAVNPGNSGGPLVDALGRVIGINTAIVGEVYQGISFAIPSNEARSVYERLRKTGRVERGWLGVALVDLEPQFAKQLGYEGEQGVIVAKVIPGSPADAAGIRAEDVILSWNGQEATSSVGLTRLVARTPIGSTVDVVIWRSGQKLTLPVQVAQRPPESN
jgi:Do/DeqQ family serine protease